MTRLFRTYAGPLYLYARRLGHDAPTAEDLTQDFAAHLLEHDDLRAVEPSRGRFRSFLLTAFKHFLLDERDRARAVKRGGGKLLVSLDTRAMEDRWEPADPSTPEQLYDQAWAMALLTRVLKRQQREQEQAGRGARFERLQEYLTGEGDGSYAQLALELSTTEGAIKVAVHRLRRRYRDLLREEVASTVGDDGDIDDELRALLDSLGGRG
jgi:RNA polymerase sigma-70 factor (ECF subfamily)